MKATITSVTNGCNGNRLVSILCNGYRYNAAVMANGQAYLFEYCGGGDDCERTRLVQKDDILRDVLLQIGA